MLRTALFWVCSSALLVHCGDPGTHVDDNVGSDASIAEAPRGPASDAAAPPDASTAGCLGQDPLSQLICQLFPAEGAQTGSSQPSLEDLLGILTEFGGALGPGAFDAGSRAGTGSPAMIPGMRVPTERDCMNPADARTERLCGLSRGGQRIPPPESDRATETRPPPDGSNVEPIDGGVPSTVARDASTTEPPDASITELPAELDGASPTS